jgi:hypothetical protein
LRVELADGAVVELDDIYSVELSAERPIAGPPLMRLSLMGTKRTYTRKEYARRTEQRAT